MIYPNSVTNALHSIISSDATIVSSGVHIDLYRKYNMNPNRTPWVGIYRPEIPVEPRRSNITQPWMATYNIPVYVQHYNKDMNLGSLDSDRLLSMVMTAVNCARTVLGQLDLTIGFTVAPYNEDITTNNNYYSYLINITAEVLS